MQTPTVGMDSHIVTRVPEWPLPSVAISDANRPNNLLDGAKLTGEEVEPSRSTFVPNGPLQVT